MTPERGPMAAQGLLHAKEGQKSGRAAADMATNFE
jgi:hypothetical protein